MELQVRTEVRISKTAEEVFEAIINPSKMANYFISGASGPMEEGKAVIWKWDDVGAELPIEVERVDKEGRFISFFWTASGIKTKTEFTLEPVNEGTLIKVCEKGWQSDEEGISRYGEQMQGWVHMLL